MTPLIEKLQADARKAVGSRAEHVTLEQALDWIATAVNVASEEAVAEFAREVVATLETMKMEEAPPFSSSDTFRRQADLVNQHIMPAVRDKATATIRTIAKEHGIEL